MSQISRAVKKDPSLKELEKDLTKNIGMKVKINAGQNDKGKVTIEYKSPAELNQILELLEKIKVKMCADLPALFCNPKYLAKYRDFYHI